MSQIYKKARKQIPEKACSLRLQKKIENKAK